VALAQVQGLHQKLFLHGVSLHVRDPYVPLHVCEDDRLERPIGLTLQAEDLTHVGVGAVPVPQQSLPFVYQELLKLAGGGRGEFVRQEVRQLQVGEATLQEGRPLVIVGVGKVNLRDTICCQALIQVRVHLIQMLGERNLDEQRLAIVTLHLPNCSLIMACSIMARWPTICPM
jgi:hypothetical protein